MTAQSEKAEREAVAADLAAQERPPAPESVDEQATDPAGQNDPDGAPEASEEAKPKRRRRTRSTSGEPVDESRRHRICAGYFTTKRPDGVEVTFIPGEALPSWAPDDAPAR